MYDITELEEELNTIPIFTSVAVCYHRKKLIVSIIAGDTYANLGFDERVDELTTDELIKYILKHYKRMVSLL